MKHGDRTRYVVINLLQSCFSATLQFMDLRTRYTALVTLTTQHVKYISDALRRLEEEEVCFLNKFQDPYIQA